MVRKICRVFQGRSVLGTVSLEQRVLSPLLLALSLLAAQPLASAALPETVSGERPAIELSGLNPLPFASPEADDEAAALSADDDLNDPQLPKPPYLQQFRQVAPTFYRGSQPTSADLRFLKEQGVKTILSLVRTPRDLIEWEQEETTVLGMNFLSFPIHSFTGPSAAKVNAIFAELLRPANQPVFVHCKHGKDRTGMIAGLYRVHFQGWSPEAAYQEARALGFSPWLLGLKHRFKKFMIQAPWETQSPEAWESLAETNRNAF